MGVRHCNHSGPQHRQAFAKAPVLLRAQHSALVLLAIVLSLSEPLACLMSCQVPSTVSPGAHQHLRRVDGQAIRGDFANAFAHAGARVLPQLFLCDFPQPTDGSSERSAIGTHDHVAVSVALVVVALVVNLAHHIVRALLAPLLVTAPPLLPPPIAQ